MKKPLIGITLDNEEAGKYSKFPWYAIRQNYLDSIYDFGGIPFPLFHNAESAYELSENMDGLIITGGNFDIDPKLYESNIQGSRLIKNNRTNFEISIFNEFLKKKKPILGICGGEQLINVACEGSLIQDIEIEQSSKIKHEQKKKK